MKRVGQTTVAHAGQSPRAHLDELEALVGDVWESVLDERAGVDDDFFAMGGTSIQAAMVTNRLQERLDVILYPGAVFDAPTIAKLAAYLSVHYPEITGRTLRREDAPKLSEEEIERGRSALASRHTGTPVSGGAKLRPAVFILAPPRSGSTLLRVMLAGSPRLFSPPELNLLHYASLAERRERLSGRSAGLREGLVRAVMELRQLGSDEAEALVAQLEASGRDTRELYALLQSWMGGRRLVDKTTTYAASVATLRRIEELFDGARFIHLCRHPIATVLSYERIRADLVTGARPEGLPASRRRQGELWWLISHSNILHFLDGVPRSRSHRLRYEDLVQDPEASVDELGRFLDLPRDDVAAMLHPYDGTRMTDGVRPASRMMGDPKFHSSQVIDADNAERWRNELHRDFLCERSWELAARLGYPREEEADEEREEWEF